MYKQPPPKAPGGEKSDPSCKVKNTFLEFSIPDEDGKRPRSQSLRSVPRDPRLSPLVVASKSPHLSPLLQPVDEKLQAVPIDEVNFELEDSAVPYPGADTEALSRRRGSSHSVGDLVAQTTAGTGREEPVYVVPTTPSPFLTSAFPPSVPPPFQGGFGGFGMSDLGLPPAFAEGDESLEQPFNMQEMSMNQFMQAQDMPALGFLPEMYDPSMLGADGNFSFAWPGDWPDPSGTGGVGVDAAPARGLGILEGGLGGFDVPKLEPKRDSPKEKSKPSSPSMAVVEKPPQDSGTPSKESRRKRGNRDKDDERPERPERPEKPERGERKERGGGKQREDRAGDADDSGNWRDRDARGDRGDKKGERDGGWRERDTRGEREVQKGGGDREGAQGGDIIPGNYTTVMLRNIPNKYTREMLVKQLNMDYHGLFDFLYLPIDFKNKCNVGYGFINFRNPDACADFVSKFHGVDVRKCLPGLNSKKIVEVTPARVQGLSENVRRLKNSPVMNQLLDHPEWMPLLFNKAGDEEPFPMPDSALPPVKPRGRNRDRQHD